MFSKYLQNNYKKNDFPKDIADNMTRLIKILNIDKEVVQDIMSGTLNSPTYSSEKNLYWQ